MHQNYTFCKKHAKSINQLEKKWGGIWNLYLFLLVANPLPFIDMFVTNPLRFSI